MMCCAVWLSAQTMSKETFLNTIESNSIDLIKSKAQFQSLLEEQKAINAWNSPYAEVEVGFAKNSQGRQELETTALFMINPKLPWVQTLLHKSLKLQSEQYKKSYDLYKNLAIIGAKRLYLTYMLTKEKYKIYTQREQNFLSQLKIAESKLKAGSMSQKDYISFNNSYLDSRLLKMQAQTQLLDLQKSLHQILGMQDMTYNANNEDNIINEKRDIQVQGFDFSYIDISLDSVKNTLKDSLYLEILALQAKHYQTSAKLANRDRFDSFEIGGGIINAESSNGATIKVSVPLPITSKNTHLKRKFLALQSGSLKEGEITKVNLAISTESYWNQLQEKKAYIELQQENIENKKSLVDMGKIAYSAQKISLFEYLAYQNSYMDSLITLADAKLEYVAIQSMLEETLGVVLGEKIGEKK